MKPNILLIVSDQLRYDCIGFAQRYPVHTPHLDRLAGEGTWFNRAYTHIPLCCPARQSLLTGARPESFGAHWNYDLGLPIPALQPGGYTWTEALQKMGYATGYLGKWHVHPDFDPTHYGYNEYVSLQDYRQFRIKKHGEPLFKRGFFGEIDPVPTEDARTHWMADRAIDMIGKYEKQHDGPWHVRLDFDEPHLPCRPSEPFASLYRPDLIPKWDNFDDSLDGKPYIQKQQLLNWGVENYGWEDWCETVALYYAFISQMDDAIGSVLDALDRSGLSERTIVVFTADHGDMCGGHRMLDKHCVMYEDIVRVPLIVRGPGIASGAVRDELVYNLLDLPPTLSDWVGFEPGSFHGRSLSPLLAREMAGPAYRVDSGWRTEVVSTYNGQQFGLFIQRMIVDARWKLVWNPTDVDELYDLQEDPTELRNRIGEPQLAAVVARLRARLYEILLAEGDRFVANPWMKRQLLEGCKL